MRSHAERGNEIKSILLCTFGCHRTMISIPLLLFALIGVHSRFLVPLFFNPQKKRNTSRPVLRFLIPSPQANACRRLLFADNSQFNYRIYICMQVQSNFVFTGHTNRTFRHTNFFLLNHNTCCSNGISHIHITNRAE